MKTERQSGFAVVASFLYPWEADLAKSLLDAHGIEAWVLDAHQVQVRSHLSGALGGVKVAVAPEKERAARSILESDHQAELDAIPETALAADPAEVCPRCGASNSSRSTRTARFSLRSLFGMWLSFAGLFLPIRKVADDWTCGACRARWTTER